MLEEPLPDNMEVEVESDGELERDRKGLLMDEQG
jgi:hypothetical protein